MKNFERVASISLIVVAIGTSALFAYTATTRVLTSLESIFLQVFALLTGLAGSFIFGRQSASEAARAIIRPHARSAFRRLLSLYSSLRRVAVTIERCESPTEYSTTLATLEAIVVEQLATADDALEDWVDIVPEDIEELRERLSTEETMGDGQ